MNYIPTQAEKELYGSKVTILKREEKKTIYQLADDIGTTEMICYSVFPGITLVYNNVHMECVQIDLEPQEKMYEINHCMEGRIECEFSNGEYLYMGKGDFSVNKKDETCHQSYFPTSHYHGVSIMIQANQAQDSVNQFFYPKTINIKALCDKFLQKNNFYLAKNDTSMGHMFYELYYVPESLKEEYFKLKVMEILLWLTTMEAKQEPVVYIPKSNVKKIKEIQKKITGSIDKNFSQEQLAHEFDISLTMMKKCFKSIYGCGIYQYLKMYRMNIAAQRLLNSDETILQIANFVGYENGSKFSSAFKAVMGVLPKEYRKGIRTVKKETCELNGVKSDTME